MASDLPVLREVGGEAAAYVAPDDVDGWAAAIGELLSSSALRDHRVAAGRTQAQRYAPEAAAMRLVDLWRSVADL